MYFVTDVLYSTRAKILERLLDLSTSKKSYVEKYEKLSQVGRNKVK